MAFGKTSGTEISELGNWNNAKIYNTAKIMTPIIKIDEYIEICNFGSTDITQEFVSSEETKVEAKLKGLKRLIKTTQMVINNSLFAVYDKKDKEKLREMKAQIKQVEMLYPLASKTINIEKQGTRHSIKKLNEGTFNNLLDILININENLLEPLNRADLIFKGSEEFDPLDYKKMVLAEMGGEYGTG